MSQKPKRAPPRTCNVAAEQPGRAPRRGKKVAQGRPMTAESAKPIVTIGSEAFADAPQVPS